MATVAPEFPVLARDEAFESLYRRYVKDVYHYALALLHNPADAEDVTQTAFMNAYRAYRRGDHIEKPHNWLIKITHNVARTRYARTARRVKEVPLEDHVEQLAVPEEERPNVEGVLRALGRLPFNQRAALVMRELEGRSYSEIAETLNVTVAAVETLIFRARRSLRVRASALRSLSAVPLPSSLSQLFGGGGALAGGGAVAGAGFVVKATVALVVAAVATGIADVQRHQGDAARNVRDVAEAQALPPPQMSARAVSSSMRVLRIDTSDGRGRVQGVVERGMPPADPTSATIAPASPGPTAQTSNSTVPAVSVPAPPVSTPTSSDVVNTVDTTVSNVSSALPVQLPSPPSLPVQPPALPSLP
jgi:RNA polymerase sigma factor (sigma-70 family)